MLVGYLSVNDNLHSIWVISGLFMYHNYIFFIIIFHFQISYFFVEILLCVFVNVINL